MSRVFRASILLAFFFEMVNNRVKGDSSEFVLLAAGKDGGWNFVDLSCCKYKYSMWWGFFKRFQQRVKSGC